MELNIEEICELVNDGLGYKKIGKTLGVSCNVIRWTMQKNGITPNGRDCKVEHQKAQIKYTEMLEQLNCRFINNYKNNGNGHIIGKCKKCGNEFDALTKVALSNESIKYGTACPKCKQAAKKNEKQEKENKKKMELINKQTFKIEKYKHEQKEKEEQFIKSHTKTCAYCGKKFFAKHLKLMCCSDECNQEYQKDIHRKYNKLHPKDKMKRISKDKFIDNDISVIKLYERDCGICGICGNICDMNDKYIDDNGTIICGDNYPSIDHVIPISKGGTHSWDNVQLAHRSCNTNKRDVSLVGMNRQGQVIFA